MVFIAVFKKSFLYMCVSCVFGCALDGVVWQCASYCLLVVFIPIFKRSFLCVRLFLFYVPATSKVMSEWVPPFDSAHSWRLGSGKPGML